MSPIEQLKEAARDYTGEKLALWFHVDVVSARCRWNGEYWEVYMGYPLGHCAIWDLNDEDLPKLPELEDPPAIPPAIIDHMQPVSPLTPEEQADYLAGKYTSYGTPPPHIVALMPGRIKYEIGVDPAAPEADYSADYSADLLAAGINQVAGAMMDAEDRAEETPGTPVVDVYHTDDTMLRVEVLVEDLAGATGYDESDIRDANRPFIPVSWRKGSGTVANLYPVEVRDQNGYLIGAWGARELQITYHFEQEPERTPAEIVRWIQARVDVQNDHRREAGEPPIPVIGRDTCATCGTLLSNIPLKGHVPYVAVDGINYCTEDAPHAE